MDEKIKLTVFDTAQIVAAGAGNHGWWKCMGCGGFAGFESSPTASAVVPWCRTGKHWDDDGKELIPLTGYTLVFDPLPENIDLA